jgi:hypothetical protein
MGKIDIIVIVLELKRKTEGMIKTSSFFFHHILIVNYVLAISVPANTISFSSLCAGVKQWFLSLIIRRVWLYEVYYVKLVDLPLSGVGHFEIVPLCVSSSVVIVLQY